MTRPGGFIAFTHASGRPVIFLPAYKSGQAVRPIHLMMVKKLLTDSGIIDPDDFAIRVPTRALPRPGRSVP